MPRFTRLTDDSAPVGGSHRATRVAVSFDPRSLWRACWVVIGAACVVSVLAFLLHSAGSALFTVVMAFFLAVAIEPAVERLARYMRRTFATALVVLALGLAIVGFFAAFGSLLLDQVEALVRSAPAVVTDVVEWVNRRFGTHYEISTLLSKISLSPEKVASYGSDLAGGLLGIVTSLVSTAFNLFALVFFTCYISAGMPRLRHWIAGLFRPSHQEVVLTVWEVFVMKVGGYVSARFILATISATVHGTFMMLIGMPYWLALGLWTGIVAQFIPNVGTYISIVLPAIVGATSHNPRLGLYILIFAICYQQVENVTIEPNISARAVDVHPAVSFASALIGAQAFGLAGGLLGVPVAATVMALIDIYKRRYDISDATVEAAQRAANRDTDEDADGDDPDGSGPVEKDAAPIASAP